MPAPSPVLFRKEVTGTEARRLRLRAGMLAIAIGAIGGLAQAIDAVANSSAVVVDLFHGSWFLFALVVVGIILVTVAVLLLPRQRQRELKLPMGLVVIAIIGGALMTGWAIGSIAHGDVVPVGAKGPMVGSGQTPTETPTTAPGPSTSVSPTTSSSPALPTFTTNTTALPGSRAEPAHPLEFAELRNNSKVPVRTAVSVIGTAVKPQDYVVVFHHFIGDEGVWTYLCERDSPGSERYTCDVQFGDPGSVGGIVVMWACGVSEGDYRKLVDFHNDGRTFNINAPPVKVAADSVKIRVNRV